MAVAGGWTGYFNLDNSAGSAQDLSAYVAEVNMTLDQQIFDITTFGSNGSRAKTTGLKDGKFTVKFFNDPVSQTHVLGLFTSSAIGSTWTFIFGPQGSASTKRRITGECLIASVPIDAKVDAVEDFTISFEVTGAVTVDAFS